MKFEAIPILRLEIDHMKHAIASAIGIDLEEALSKILENSKDG